MHFLIGSGIKAYAGAKAIPGQERAAADKLGARKNRKSNWRQRRHFAYIITISGLIALISAHEAEFSDKIYMDLKCKEAGAPTPA
jgi:hypothetical protein